MARRRNEWISAVSRGDATTKRVLESEQVCSKHFVFNFVSQHSNCRPWKEDIFRKRPRKCSRKSFESQDGNKRSSELAELKAAEKKETRARKR